MMKNRQTIGNVRQYNDLFYGLYLKDNITLYMVTVYIVSYSRLFLISPYLIKLCSQQSLYKSNCRSHKYYNQMIDVQPAELDCEPYSSQKTRQQLRKSLQILSKLSPTSDQVKVSNEIIIKYLTEPGALKQLILLLIQASGQNTMCSLIISFISFYLRQQVNPGICVVRHDKRSISDRIKAIFFCSTVSDKHKKMLVASFSEFLSSYSPDFIKIRKSLCQQIVQYFFKSQNLSIADMSNVMFLIEAILTPNLESQNLRLLQQSLLSNFVELSEDLLKKLGQSLVVGNIKILDKQRREQLQWTQKVVKITKILFINANIDKVLRLKSNLIVSSNLANMCIIGLGLAIQQDQVTGQMGEQQKKEVDKYIIDKTGFLVVCETTDGYQILNSIKTEVTNLMIDYMKYLIKGQKRINDNKFVHVKRTLLYLIQEIIPVLAKDVEGYPNKQIGCKQLFKNTLVLLSKVVRLPQLLNEATQIRDLVMIKICYLCLLSTPQDKALSPQDFCFKRQKIINYENPTNIHQAATSLIQSYADQIYGTVPYLVNSMINFMQFQLTADPKYFQLLPSILPSSEFYNKHSYYEHFQVGLTVLAILGYHADAREDIDVLIQQFVIRRQEFFSRIDLPDDLIVCFLIFCSYYLGNFYQLILNGKVNAGFHRALLFHVLELLNASFNQNTKDFINSSSKKIGIQAIDYISNAVIQPYFFSAVFPAWNSEATQMLVTLIDKICVFFDSTSNISVIQEILIDFVTRCIKRHYPEGNNFQGMPEVLRDQICIKICQQIIANFKPNLPNETIAKQKLLQLYQNLLIFCKDPVKLFEMGLQMFNHITQTQYSYIEQCVTLIRLLLRRIASLSIPPTSLSPICLQIITKCILKSMKICDNETFETEIFDIVVHINMMKIKQDEFVNCLLEVFEERLQEKDTDDEAQIIMQKCLYLIMQAVFSNFAAVAPSTWLRVLERMIQYMRVFYKTQNTITIGKATCICLCCYIQDPEGVQNFLGSRIEGLWDCILDDHLKYNTIAQKKVACTELLLFLNKYSHRSLIKDKFVQILKSTCILIYYIYEKSQIKFSQQIDSENESNSQNSSEQSQKKPWKPCNYTMRENPFVDSLPDERGLLKNICVKLNEADHENFERFIKDLPIGLQNTVKNKVMMYREDTGVVNKTKMRTIYRVKQMQSQE